MSTFVSIKSICGRITSKIDIFDLDLNPHGVVCCNECESILGFRQAWDGMGDFLESQWSDAEDE